MLTHMCCITGEATQFVILSWEEVLKSNNKASREERVLLCTLIRSKSLPVRLLSIQNKRFMPPTHKIWRYPLFREGVGEYEPFGLGVCTNAPVKGWRRAGRSGKDRWDGGFARWGRGEWAKGYYKGCRMDLIRKILELSGGKLWEIRGGCLGRHGSNNTCCCQEE